MPVKLDGGSILLDSGSIALHDDCCCGCECTVVDSWAPCECINTAYDTSASAGAMGAASVTLSGSLAARSLSNGADSCSAPTCPSIAGTYTRSCTGGSNWHIWTYVCSVDAASIRKHYHYITQWGLQHNGADGTGNLRVTFGFSHTLAYQSDSFFGSPPSIPSGVQSGVFSLPPSTDTSGYPWFQSGQGSNTWSFNWPRLARWVYLNTGSCDTSCNTSDFWEQCITGSQSWTSTTVSAISNNACDSSTLSVALSIV